MGTVQRFGGQQSLAVRKLLCVFGADDVAARIPVLGIQIDKAQIFHPDIFPRILAKLDRLAVDRPTYAELISQHTESLRPERGR